MKNKLKLISALCLIISMSACKDSSDIIDYAEEISYTVFCDISDESVTHETYMVPDSEVDTVDNDEYYQYSYFPPREVLDTEFYCDRIEAEIVFESLTEDMFGDPNVICSALPERVPEDIANDLSEAIADKTHFRAYDLKPVDLKPIEVSCFEYDLNSDENVDYLFSVQMRAFPTRA
ncbi:MAG: hypothetical protein K2O14_07330 [Oscillospiraceae bacterium]|nr:hypothetical protein [Oscillospiraceae bacterium]